MYLYYKDFICANLTFRTAGKAHFLSTFNRTTSHVIILQVSHFSSEITYSVPRGSGVLLELR